MNIVIYHSTYRNEALEQFMETLFDNDLCFLASELADYGISPAYEIEQAVERAMKICKTSQYDIRQHFKPVIVCKESILIRDWKLSPLARKLVVLNSNPSNPWVARLQMELLNRV